MPIYKHLTAWQSYKKNYKLYPLTNSQISQQNYNFHPTHRRKNKHKKDGDADNPFEMRLMLTDVRRSQEDRMQSSQYSVNSYNEEGTLMLQEYKDDIGTFGCVDCLLLV